MNVLIASGIAPPEIGGPSSVIPGISAELRDRGHEVTLVTYTPNPRAIDGVSIVSVSRSGSAIRRYLRFAKTVRGLLERSDLVLATDVFSVGIPTRLGLVGYSQKLVLRLGGEWCWELAVSSGRWHGTLRDYWKAQPGLLFRLCLGNYRWLLRRASLIVTTSDLLKEILHRRFGNMNLRIHTVPNVDAPIDDAKSRVRPHHPLRLLYAGRFARVKNVPFLAGVLRKLRERDIPVTCTFAGEGEELERCRLLLADMPEMKFLGRVERHELAALFATHDVYVLPSLSDLCPNGVVEARLCGLPCIITSENGLPHPFPGILQVAPSNQEAWVEAISRLRDEDSYRALASQPRRFVWSGETRWSSILEAV